jgi:hypothetical protein
MQGNGLLDQNLHVLAYSSCRSRYSQIGFLERVSFQQVNEVKGRWYLQRLDVGREPVTHNSNKLSVNFILMFLIILCRNVSSVQKMEPLTYPLEFIKLYKYYSLLGTEMSSKCLPDVRNESNHDG